MRFLRLQIPAFGPFTNIELNFAEEPGDLQVIYGPNEAGKSSLLRAVGDLLFGIHGQSPDNFLHDYATMRIKGEIRNRAGQTLVFQRRKGNKNTLLDAKGDALPDSALRPFLGSVDRPYFSAMFGLGARELRDEAQQILHGEGDIGTALFSASMGGTPIQRVVAALQEEADRLFRGRATANVSIRPACNRYRELLRQSREAMVDPERWARLEKELAEAGTSKSHLEDQISQLDQTIQWLGRCEDALPAVGRLEEELHKLRQLPDLPELASDFIPRAREAREAVARNQAKAQQLAVQIRTLQDQQADFSSNPAVMAEAEALERLHQGLGAHRARKETLAGLRVSMDALELLLKAGMQQLQLSGEIASLEHRRLSSPARLACEEAARTLTHDLREHTTNSAKVEELESQISDRVRRLQSPPEADLADLRDALSVAAEATEADRTLATSESEVQRWHRETTDQHRLIVGAPPDLDAAAALPVPALATIRRYRDQMDGLQRDLKEQGKKLAEGRKETSAIQTALRQLQRQGDLPSEEALREARAHRDRGWTLVLAEWKGAGARETLDPHVPLEEAFPQAIAKADAIADQLRLQAEAVAQAEERKFQLGEAEKRTADAREKVTLLHGTLAECQSAWESEWSACGISPRPPVEMEEWRDQWVGFRDRLGRLKAAQESLQRKTHQILSARQQLAAVLGQSEAKEFSLLFAAARKRVQDGEQTLGRREEMGRQLEALTIELTRHQQQQARLAGAAAVSKENWKRQCQAVGLPEGTSPDDGLALLRERTDLLSKFDDWRRQSVEAQAAAEAVSEYEHAIRGKATVLGYPRDTIEATETALWRAFTEAGKAQTRSEQLARQIQQMRGELERAQEDAAGSQRALNDLIQLAGLDSVDTLEPFLSRLEQRREAHAHMDSLRNTLGGLARGQAVDPFVSLVRAEDPDTLARRKAAASRLKEELASTLQGARETLYRLAGEKRALEVAGDTAADFRQHAESCAAALKRDGARFLRLRLATHLLQTQIERFRRENQGPLLQQSAVVFQALTRGAFRGLSAEFNADDLPVLKGVRPDQTRVSVEGLSDGTRDQLYLALRLAALERHLEEHEPMPLILDDLLVTFDDQRVEALLPQLAALAKRTQIFLFTHHQHLVELCRRTWGQEGFHLHILGSAP